MRKLMAAMAAAALGIACADGEPPACVGKRQTVLENRSDAVALVERGYGELAGSIVQENVELIEEAKALGCSMQGFTQ